MRTRFDNNWEKTRGNLKIEKIIKVVGQFPTLHAYGVGFKMFLGIPEANRSKAIDYARYMLAFELDDEIDAAYAFLKTIGINVKNKSENFVRSDYLEYLYSYWRREGKKHPEVMPIGVFALAALMLDANLRIVEGLKPHFLIPVSRDKRSKVESYLELTQGFKPWDDEQIFWNVIE